MTLDILISVVSISVIGLIIFGIAFLLIVNIAPFSVKKEIEEDQNTSLGILIGSIFISLAIIISAAIS
jgi:uncharacterized membrane protein YjfL (UPF0719 family)